jgi:microcystin-dependent protein
MGLPSVWSLAMRCRSMMYAVVAGSMMGLGTPALAETSGPAGGGQAFDNRSPSLALTAAISRFGIFGTGVAVRLFAFPLPEGWDAADGRLLPRAGNQFLFDQIGTTYGGDGVNTFALPDLRGRSPIGAGSRPSAQTVGLAQAVGSDSVTLVEGQLPVHTHGKPFGGLTGSAGAGAPFDNRHASLGLRYSIAFQGIFPSRPVPPPVDGGNGGHGGGDRGSAGTPSLPYMGQVFLHSVPPTTGGFQPADGAIYNLNQYGAMFSLFGTFYGGNGTNSFAVPDLRGRTALGADGVFNSIYFGATSGADLSTLTTAQIPAHAHTLGAYGDSLPEGDGLAFDNRQPTQAITYCIVETGVFPSGSGMDDLDIYVGEVIAVGSNFNPVGTIPCDGRLLSVTGHEVLHYLFGNTYGGDGVNNFRVPDLRGRVPVGVGNGRALGSVAGENATTLTVGQLPVHTHQFTPPCTCDLNFDGERNTADLTIFLGTFGFSVPAGTLGDLNGDGLVNTQDLTIFLGRFGVPC